MYKYLHLWKKSIIFAENLGISLKVGPNIEPNITNY